MTAAVQLLEKFAVERPVPKCTCKCKTPSVRDVGASEVEPWRVRGPRITEVIGCWVNSSQQGGERPMPHVHKLIESFASHNPVVIQNDADESGDHRVTNPKLAVKRKCAQLSASNCFYAGIVAMPTQRDYMSSQMFVSCMARVNFTPFATLYHPPVIL